MKRVKHIPRRFPLKDFDFDRLAEVYKTLKWRWVAPGGDHQPTHVPDARELKVAADYLLNEIDTNGISHCASGGIEVCRVDGVPMIGFSKRIEALLS